MNYKIHRYELKFKRPFVLSQGIRTGTEALFLELIIDGESFWGEAVFPPYLEPKYNLCSKEIQDFFENIEDVRNLRNSLSNADLTAVSLCAIDNALTQFEVNGVESFRRINNIQEKLTPLTLTFSKSDVEIINEKKELSKNFTHVKLKWTGAEDDIEFSKWVFDQVGLPIAIDANQGYINSESILSRLRKLERLPIELVEQPFNKLNIEEHFQLSRSIQVPLFADESIQDHEDFMSYKDAFHGVNIKLLKCGGIHRAKELIDSVKGYNKRALIGSMAESSLGMTMAATLAPLCDYADLDAPYLIINDPFSGAFINDRILYLDKIKKVPNLDTF